MAKKKSKEPKRLYEGEAAEPRYQPITETIEQNYMPYAMSVIISRAIPEIDGFKPSHRKLLYTMYKMGLLTGKRTKSANVVGQTMKLNPHGDAAIYETLVRLTRGNDALLHPFIDSKGSFGKQYSSEMKFAASRYTEVKLDPFCREIFTGIDRDAVDMVDNYDNTMKEPVLLPTAFPNILVSPNMGIAVGMASKICSFNLGEVCDGAIQLLHNPSSTVDQILDIIRAPDFPGGGSVIYNRDEFREIYQTGRGSFRLRAKCSFDKSNNCLEVLEIPYSTSAELIMKKVADLVKEGKLKEITDMRDEIDLSGFKIAFDVRRGTDHEKLLAKLYKLTPLQDNFDCNFNVLVDYTPKQLGIIGILNEWIRFRIGCVKRELTFELNKKKDKLHLLLGLGKILLDIDKAIKIVRETKLDKDVVPNLMAGFDIDELQAEYIADIKLRYLNREYILNRVQETAELQNDIAELEKKIGSERALRSHIAAQLKEIKKKYGKPRRTEIIYEEDIEEYSEQSFVENYNVKLTLTKEGYFKKITLQSLRGSDVHKLKEGDEIKVSEDATNLDEVLFFSDKAQVYKARVSDFDTTKASELGDYIPAKLGFDEGEKVLTMKTLSEYKEGDNMIFIFANGKGVRVPITTYQTKTNRKKLTNAYSDAAAPVDAFYEPAGESTAVMLISNMRKAIIVDSSLISIKTTRTSQGITLFKLKAKQYIEQAVFNPDPERYVNIKKYRKTKIPASGVTLEELDVEARQISLGADDSQ
ncbi:MAG: topoisomerase IV [Clostridia bacterium]|nr:topoisomerase IV [Clostridia bacterium]